MVLLSGAVSGPDHYLRIDSDGSLTLDPNHDVVLVFSVSGI
jgi:hypothetical protein